MYQLPSKNRPKCLPGKNFRRIIASIPTFVESVFAFQIPPRPPFDRFKNFPRFLKLSIL